MRAALGFLTILPVRAASRPPGPAALASFPAVGLLIGGAQAATAAGTLHLWNPLVAASTALLVGLILTGGLHLDALVDTCDGLASRKPVAEALAVMRDPHVGAVGVAALGVVLLMWTGLLAGALEAGQWAAIVLAPAVGRLTLVWTLARARGAATPAPHSSLAANLRSGARWWAVSAGCVLTVGAGVVLGGLRGAVAVLLGIVVGEVCNRGFRCRFGALTGDGVGTSGAAAELAALMMLTVPTGPWDWPIPGLHT